MQRLPAHGRTRTALGRCSRQRCASGRNAPQPFGQIRIGVCVHEGCRRQQRDVRSAQGTRIRHMGSPRRRPLRHHSGIQAIRCTCGCTLYIRRLPRKPQRFRRCSCGNVLRRRPSPRPHATPRTSHIPLAMCMVSRLDDRTGSHSMATGIHQRIPLVEKSKKMNFRQVGLHILTQLSPP